MINFNCHFWTSTFQPMGKKYDSLTRNENDIAYDIYPTILIKTWWEEDTNLPQWTFFEEWFFEDASHKTNYTIIKCLKTFDKVLECNHHDALHFKFTLPWSISSRTDYQKQGK